MRRLRNELLIVSEEKIIRRLHDAVHETFKDRSKNETCRDAWESACDSFREYASPLKCYIDRIRQEDLSDNSELKEFALDFLQIDPDFFRSGYMKETILRKLKNANLDKGEEERVQVIIVDAVINRGRREYRDYCNLAANFAQFSTIDRVKSLAKNSDSAICSRALMMLDHVAQKAKWISNHWYVLSP